MAVKISELTTTTTVTGDEVLPMVQNGVTKGVAIGDIVPIRRTPAETAAGVTPVSFQYDEGYLYRYGENTTPGTTDMTTALANALKVMNGREVHLPGDLIATDAQDIATLCPDGIKIVGAGTQNTRLILRETAASAQQIFGALNLEVSDVVIRDMTLDCNNAIHGSGGSAPNNDVCGIRIGDNNNGGDQSYRIKVQNVRVLGATLHGIIVSHGSDVLIEGCSVEGYVGFGIIGFRGCTNFRITNNYVTTTVAASAAIIIDSRSTVSTTPEPGQELVITGNHIDGNDVMTTGINVPDSYSTNIIGNTILDVAVVGINIDENEAGSVPEQAAQYTNVIGNIIRGQSNTGAESAAILCVGQYVNICENIIYDSAASGILLFDDAIATVIPTFININNNIIENAGQSNGASIQVQCGSHLNIGNNTIANSGRYGIRLISSDDPIDGVNVVGNIIDGCAQDGMDIRSDASAMSNVSIRSNQISRIDTGSAGNKTGIRIVKGTAALSGLNIEGNDIFGQANASFGFLCSPAGVTGQFRLVNNRCDVSTSISMSDSGDISYSFGNNFAIPAESATGTFTASIGPPVTSIDSSGGAVTVTCPDGTYEGQRKVFAMSDATASSTVSVTSHETSDPEVFTFAEVTDYLVLEWSVSNAYWWTVKNIGVVT